jgi:Ca-activated chloride channel family protein
VSLASPIWLLTLLGIPIALLAQWAARRRARRYAVRFTALPALKVAASETPSWRKHVPTALLLAAVAALAFALAKPQRTVAVPVQSSTIMLVTDHSRSMLATDVDPDRITAAKKAANAFLDQLPSAVKVGIVAYSDFPDAVQSPTTDHSVARRVVNSEAADGATATGDALTVALDALVSAQKSPVKSPAAIVLLSDGKTTTGTDPVEVARQNGKKKKIPIYTVSLGTETATVPNPGFGPPLPATPDPETLRQIAQVSGGRAFTAEDDSRLSSIYRSLGAQLGTKKKKREVTAAFAVGGLVLLLGAAATSMRFAGRLP